jgi:hypothetical protein
MQNRNLWTLVLAVFMGICVVVIAVRQLDHGTQPAQNEPGPPGSGSPAVPAAPTPQTSPPGKAASAAQPAKVRLIVYYFHGTERCDNCRTAEAYAQEAVQLAFAKELAEGRIEWRSVNFDEPANEHFKKDYLVDTPSLVLVRMEGDKQVAWEVLKETFVFVTSNDKDGFFGYLQGRVRAHW